MSVHGDAAQLERLLPQAMAVLFHSSAEDPLRHHSVGHIRLMRLLLTGSQTASQLGQSLGLSPSSLTQMTSRMITAGLVSKELGAEDRRVRMFSLTPAGRALMENRQAMRAGVAALQLQNLDEAKRAQLIRLLEEVTALETPGGPARVEALV